MIVRLSMSETTSATKITSIHAPIAQRPSLLRNASSMVSLNEITRFDEIHASSDTPYSSLSDMNQTITTPPDITVECRGVSEV